MHETRRQYPRSYGFFLIGLLRPDTVPNRVRELVWNKDGVNLTVGGRQVNKLTML